MTDHRRPRSHSSRPYPPRRRRRPRRRGRLVAWTVLLAVVGALAYGVSAVVSAVTRATAVSACSVGTSGSTSYELTPEQTQNAAIIAGVGFKMGLPDHAVTVALATALQESKLRNLTYGDLDSVGLFQQRPSEGWGTRDQILDPVYATGAFYSHLEQVPGWRTMAVTSAAQAVQHSAGPDAYAQWEGEARALAMALTGESPATLTCRLTGFAGPPPAAGALTAAAAGELGSSLLDRPLPAKTGWEVASWAVAHAWQYHLSRVSFAGQVWTPSSGKWRPGGPVAAGDVVRVT